MLQIRRMALALAAASALAAGGARAQEQTPAARPPFSEWLAAVRTEALGRGIRPEIVKLVFDDLTEPLPTVIERDRNQAEIVQPLEQYVSRRVTPALVKTGRENFAKQHELFEQVSAKYGVSPAIIAGVWGVESNFGRFAGARPTIPALATLAWDHRRAAFFRAELFDALEILNRGDIEPENLRGSWAGAMGQVQFMPSSYLKYAEDFDGDGHKDIWSSPPDIFASIANYLKGHGWKTGTPWGREVTVGTDATRRIAAEVTRRTGTCQATRDMTVPLPPERWKELGVKPAAGASWPEGDGDIAMVSGETKHYLVTANYDVLLDYNCAHAYAVSVGLLADLIEHPDAPVQPAAAKHTKPKPKHKAASGR